MRVQLCLRSVSCPGRLTSRAIPIRFSASQPLLQVEIFMKTPMQNGLVPGRVGGQYFPGWLWLGAMAGRRGPVAGTGGSGSAWQRRHGGRWTSRDRRLVGIGVAASVPAGATPGTGGNVLAQAARWNDEGTVLVVPRARPLTSAFTSTGVTCGTSAARRWCCAASTRW